MIHDNRRKTNTIQPNWYIPTKFVFNYHKTSADLVLYLVQCKRHMDSLWILLFPHLNWMECSVFKHIPHHSTQNTAKLDRQSKRDDTRRHCLAFKSKTFVLSLVGLNNAKRNVTLGWRPWNRKQQYQFMRPNSWLVHSLVCRNGCRRFLFYPRLT